MNANIKTNYSALYTLVIVFFFWGFIAAGNSIFIPFCKSYFGLDQFQSQLIDFAFLILPLISIFLVVNIRYWYVLAIFLIISAIIQTLSICLKYAFYEPGRTINKSIFITVYALSIFVPFFVPVPLIMMVHYFRKAESNLNHFLYDYS